MNTSKITSVIVTLLISAIAIPAEAQDSDPPEGLLRWDCEDVHEWPGTEVARLAADNAASCADENPKYCENTLKALRENLRDLRNRPIEVQDPLNDGLTARDDRIGEIRENIEHQNAVSIACQLDFNLDEILADASVPPIEFIGNPNELWPGEAGPPADLEVLELPRIDYARCGNRIAFYHKYKVNGKDINKDTHSHCGERWGP